MRSGFGKEGDRTIDDVIVVGVMRSPFEMEKFLKGDRVGDGSAIVLGEKKGDRCLV